MSNDVELKPGWLARDVKQAADRAEEWKGNPLRNPVRLPRIIVEAFEAGAHWRGKQGDDVVSRREIDRAAENYAWTGDPENDDGP